MKQSRSEYSELKAEDLKKIVFIEDQKHSIFEALGLLKDKKKNKAREKYDLVCGSMKERIKNDMAKY